MTSLLHLKKNKETWEYIQETHKSAAKDPELSFNKIDSAEFRKVEDPFLKD